MIKQFFQYLIINSFTVLILIPLICYMHQWSQLPNIEFFQTLYSMIEALAIPIALIQAFLEQVTETIKVFRRKEKQVVF